MASISMSTFLQGLYLHAFVQTHGIFPMAIRLRGDINSSAILHVDDNLRGGFGSGGSGFGQIHCMSIENKLTDYPSANRPLIGSGGRVG